MENKGIQLSTHEFHIWLTLCSSYWQVNIEYGSFYAELKTNEHLTALYKKHCSDLGLKFPKQDNNNIVGLSSDMGNVSFVTPTIHAFFEINTNAATHTQEFANAAGKSILL